MEGLTKIADLGKPRVVIVGGGFGGLQLAKELADAPVQIVLIDKHNYHAFQPLLYQVGTAGLNADSIISPFRKILNEQENFYFRLADVKSIDPTAQVVETSIGLLHYDYLILATGTTSNYFGDKQMEENSISLKSVGDAIELRNTLLSNFEQALEVGDSKQLNSLLDFVIVGGGPTGVEMAGALSELRAHVFPRDYPELDLKQMDIHLVQSGPVLLKGMSAEASEHALKYLQEMDVQVWLDNRVTSYDGYTVALKSGEKLVARTLIWAAGVTGAPVVGLAPAALLKSNRYQVNEFNQVAGYENVFAIGDIAQMATEGYPEGHPQVAQPAIQQGRLLGENLKHLLNKQPLKPFVYQDKGTMATIGRHRAVGDIILFGKQYHITGWLGWLGWSFVHIMALVSFRNRIAVFIAWAWNYITQDKGMRYIIGKPKAPLTERAVEVKPVT
ncbi:NAD(P)/FAD-dependent oxidoreductase [Hymenobacter arcticus]